MQLNLSSMAISADEVTDTMLSVNTQDLSNQSLIISSRNSFYQSLKPSSGLNYRPLPLLVINQCFNRVQTIEKLIFHPVQASHTDSFKSELSIASTASSRWLKFGTKVLGMIGVVLPISYLIAMQWGHIHTETAPATALPAMISTYDKVVSQKVLKVATVNDPSTYFASDSFEHGFGYDVARQYAHHLDATVQTVVFENERKAMAALQAGEIDIALTQTAANDDTVQTVALSCNQDFLSAQGLSNHVALQVRGTDTKLANDAKAFLCQPDVLQTHAYLAQFYSQNVLANDYSEQHFTDTLAQALPIYRTSFEKNAKQHQLDWHLLVAMGYQESHLQPDAVSPTGVQGLMMLTNDTAQAMGVTDRIDPIQSIKGGAKYLQKMQKQFIDVAESDRVWFALASYNMGPQAVKNIQENLRSQGRDGNNWGEVYRYMAENQAANSRYTQCMQYVTHIRSYLEAIKRTNETNREVA